MEAGACFAAPVPGPLRHRQPPPGLLIGSRLGPDRWAFGPGPPVPIVRPQSRPADSPGLVRPRGLGFGDLSKPMHPNGVSRRARRRTVARRTKT